MHVGLTLFFKCTLKIQSGFEWHKCSSLGEEGSGSAISLCIYLYFFKKSHYNNIILNTHFEVLDTYHLENLQN